MLRQLQEGLDRLAALVDPAHLESAKRLQQAAWCYQPVQHVPFFLLDLRPPEWPLFPYREALENPEKMLWNELLEIYVGLTLKDDRMLTVRANFGPGVVASLFGARLISIDDETPWVEPLRSSKAIRAVVERGIPELDSAWGARVMEAERLYRDLFAYYPRLKHHVHIFVSDTQGPFDTAHLLWGEEIYIAVHEEPELVHRLLDLITEVTIAFNALQKAVVGEPRDEAYHFWYWVPGGVRVVDDVAVNLSAEMYAEFCLPYNDRVLQAFGGGYMHYCGHKLHSHELRLATPGLRGVEMGFDNPSRNLSYSLESVYAEASRRKEALLWMQRGMPLRRPPIETGLIYGCEGPDIPWDRASPFVSHARAFWTNPVSDRLQVKEVGFR